MKNKRETIVRDFLKSRFRGYSDDLGVDQQLSTILDSLGQFEFIEFVEQKFGFKIPHEEFRPDRFSTIRTVLQTIQEFGGPGE